MPWFPISIVIFLILDVFLILWKIQPYGYSISALIGIWDGFAEINPNTVDTDFIIFRDGGYDGQFFYFIAKSIFNDQNWGLIVDSYLFRLHRIGFTLIVGYPSSIFGFKYYPWFAVLIPLSLFLVSVICLRALLPEKKRIFVIFYLFSPYSLNSHLLLVADGLFTSLAVITIYCYKHYDVRIVTILLLTVSIFTREIGLFLIAPFVLSFLLEKRYKLALVYSLPIILFLGFLLWTRIVTPLHLGTNPLGFYDMVDYPLFGFMKSFFDDGKFHVAAKESIKFLLFGQFLLLIFYQMNLWKKPSIEKIMLHFRDVDHSLLLLPVTASIAVILFAEEGYWRSFDNLSRMFTLSLPLVILMDPNRKSKLLSLFLYSSFLLFLFIIIRIVFITKIKDFYLAL